MQLRVISFPQSSESGLPNPCPVVHGFCGSALLTEVQVSRAPGPIAWVFVCLCVFKTGSHSVAQANLELVVTPASTS